ncbi:uncharacterized protein LOC6576401 [Drosophila mojavensis]|uniref:Chitin-binding type-2 domain-containing protein n=1 Tax=Drosophila mojavensis TaxID=7230 RepID=B4KE88_DROMO|nr:uncharacterized protein LOC6576401 [Drosophila mojavensis]EDW11833.1 uncharacterized protein Dmoj_GI12955 [Drosophila mojavensis]
MKAALILLCLALFVVAIYADCDPNGNGLPNCSGTSTTRYRNNWDPTRYWVCEGNTPTVVKCDIGLGYDPVTSECIPWSQWQWYPVCSDSN